MNRTRTWARTAFLPLTLSLSACIGGGKGQVQFHDTLYPVSMSKATFDAAGKIAPEENVEVLGQLEASANSWNLVWGLVQMSDPMNFSEEVNTQVQQLGGEAVRKLRIKTLGSPLNYIPFVSILPFWPTAARCKIQGEIIRYRS